MHIWIWLAESDICIYTSLIWLMDKTKNRILNALSFENGYESVSK